MDKNAEPKAAGQTRPEQLPPNLLPSSQTPSSQSSATPPLAEQESGRVTDSGTPFEVARVTRRKVKPHPRINDFNDAQLSKDHTLALLAFDSVTRQSYFLSNRPYLTPQQVDQVRDLIDSYEHRFKQLLNKRADILEHAFDGEDTEIALKNIAVRTLLLNRLIRVRIQREVMTREQRDSLDNYIDDRRAKIIEARKAKEKKK